MPDKPRVKHVWCSPSGGPGQLGHIVRTAYENEAGETKSDICYDGVNVMAMAYREPSDRDEQGSGGTFWNIVVGVEGSNQS